MSRKPGHLRFFVLKPSLWGRTPFIKLLGWPSKSFVISYQDCWICCVVLFFCFTSVFFWKELYPVPRAAGLALWSRTGLADEDRNKRAVGEDCQGDNTMHKKCTLEMWCSIDTQNSHTYFKTECLALFSTPSCVLFICQISKVFFCGSCHLGWIRILETQTQQVEWHIFC